MISYLSTKGRSSFTTCEDSLTSSVLDLLKYLPIELFWKILKDSLYHDELPETTEDYLRFEYWPKWNAENTPNTSFVEPDVFLSFKDFDVIIEAKRYDRNGQTLEQFNNEVQAYYNEYQNCKKLYFIELGGLNNSGDNKDDNSNKNGVIRCKTDWSRLLKAIENLRQKQVGEDKTLPAHINRILADCIKAFSLHQFYSMQWLEDLKEIKIETLEIPLNFI